jgi:uncharacterized SAM-binding protein YcdF (DUF218 family)
MKPSRIILLAVLICMAAAAVFHGALLRWAYDFLSIHGEPVHADAIVVFCGGGGERMEYGVKLFREGFSGRLLFCGTDAEARFARSVLRGMGVAEAGPVQVRGGLRGTYESLEYVKAWARENMIGSFLAVSSPLHMRRLRLLGGRLLGKGPPRPILCPVPEPEMEAAWWNDASVRRNVLQEWKKLLWTWFRYWK